jgi:hypothetical protein
MKFKKLPLILACAGIFFASCQKEELNDNETLDTLTKDEISQDIIGKISSRHFNPEGAKLGKLLLPDGSFEKAYFIEGDIAITEDQLDQMSPDEVTTK